MISRRTVLKSLAAAAAVPYLGPKPAAAITKPNPTTFIKSTWSFRGDEDILWPLGFDGVQHGRSPVGISDRLPDNGVFGFEIQTRRGNFIDHKDLIDQGVNEPKLKWITLNVEVERDDEYRHEIHAYIRQKLPEVLIVGGPVAGWAFNSTLPLDDYDVLVSFYNVHYPDRFGADFAWILASHLYSEKPMWLMPQPVHGSTHKIVQPDEYVDACEVCEFSDWAVGMWSHDDVINSPNFRGRRITLRAWEKIQQRAVPSKDNCVLIPYRGKEKVSGWRELRALARMVWDAGYIPYAVDETIERDEHEDARFFDWERVVPLVSNPNDYGKWRIWLHDFGHPSRPHDDIIRGTVRSYEREAADEIDAILTADGLCEKVR